MRSALALLALLAAPPALAEEPPFPDPCTDPLRCVLSWDPVQDGSEVIGYDVVDADTGALCFRLAPAIVPRQNGPGVRRIHARTWVWPQAFREYDDGSCFPREAVGNHFVIYAVDEGGLRSVLPSNVATFIGQVVACLGPNCERPCWPGAPLRLPHLPVCPEGTP